MPLELGIAMAERTAKRKLKDRHEWLLLVPQGHPYRQFVSDLAGYDPTEYDRTPNGVVSPVIAWLATRPDAPVQCTIPRDVLSSLPDFHIALTELREKWQGQPPWRDLVSEAQSIATKNGLIPIVSA
jgi:hypothetical protein